MNLLRAFCLAALLLVAYAPVSAQEQPGVSRFPIHYAPDQIYTGQRVEDLPAVPEEHVDVGLWALVVAKDYDPLVNVRAYLQKLDEMAGEVRHMLAGRTSDMDKLLAVRAFLYEPGPWNGYRAFGYDLDDPLGKRPGNPLISTYLDTRLGNCVTMPTLFLALMERVGPDVPVRGVMAPLHLFLRFRDRQTGDVWNVETTNGGQPARNQWYVDQFRISQAAVASGAYLRDLTKREYLGELVGVLTRQARSAGRYEQALRYAELTLALNPRSVNGLVQRGAVQEWIAFNAVEGAKARGEKLDEAEMERLRALNRASQASIEQAQRLGWTPERPEDRAAYLEAVKAERQRRSSTQR